MMVQEPKRTFTARQQRRLPLYVAWFSIMGALCSVAGAASIGATPAGASSAVLSIHVKGAQFFDAAGELVHLRGASVADLGQFEKNADAWPNFGLGGEPDFASMAAWHMNVVRFPLNEANWLRYKCDGIQPDPRNNSQTALKHAVAAANAAGLYVILDLHWAAPGVTLCPTGQGPYADMDHSVAFWTSVAAAFKDNPAVMFELFNEPFGDNVYANWSGQDGVLLRDGGSDSDFLQQNPATGSLVHFSINWQVAGFNQLIAAIRATGASNVILASPIGFAGEIQLWEKFRPSDPAGQLAVAWHVYGNHKIGAAQQVLDDGWPIVITETNGKLTAPGGGGIDNQVFNWADAHDVGYLWWGWTPYSPTDDLDIKSSCHESGSFRLTSGSCATPTPVGSLFRTGLACAATGAQNCW
jgi:hypothetical protein